MAADSIRWTIRFSIRRYMKTRTILLTVALCFMAAAVSFASNANMGTWKLNEAKSKIPATATKNNTVVYETAGDNVKVTVDGTDGQGKPTHNEWTGKFDGKDYPLTGDASADTRAYKSIDARTTELINKKSGNNHGSNCYIGGRQKPHRHCERNQSEWQQSRILCGVRQTVAGSLPRSDSNDDALPFDSGREGIVAECWRLVKVASTD